VIKAMSESLLPSTSSALPGPSNPEHSDILMQDLEKLIRQQRDPFSFSRHDRLPKPGLPFMLQPDVVSSGLKTTRVGAHYIWCFIVGGECRLCYPQFISLILPDIPSKVIDHKQAELRISNLQATTDQLEVLKLNNIIPTNMSKCNLITKTNAERLISALKPYHSPPLTEEERQKYSIKVEHDCLGGCEGKFYPEINFDNCIECSTCLNTFSPDEFVCHTHTPTNGDICHWGFDSANWRFYLRPHETVEEDVTACAIFRAFIGQSGMRCRTYPLLQR
jgi:NAD-dependent dihydropyrimidine dehydrogenase PreA subunit